ncbi:hypothetical protein QR685DRAFT_82296 [Neurospora intermedia]|uniref:Secreted protein n=1 Tax=Neurospora intermedia TaxID=5142 RepID=A0ABR3D3N4_NEUIN
MLTVSALLASATVTDGYPMLFNRKPLVIFACHSERSVSREYVLEMNRARGQWRTHERSKRRLQSVIPRIFCFFSCQNNLLPWFLLVGPWHSLGPVPTLCPAQTAPYLAFQTLPVSLSLHSILN